MLDAPVMLFIIKTALIFDMKVAGNQPVSGSYFAPVSTAASVTRTSPKAVATDFQLADTETSACCTPLDDEYAMPRRNRRFAAMFVATEMSPVPTSLLPLTACPGARAAGEPGSSPRTGRVLDGELPVERSARVLGLVRRISLVRALGRTHDAGMTMKSLKHLSESFASEKDEINRKHVGRIRKIRLMIADLTYALGMLEGGLGAASVRENWAKHVDRMWRAQRDEDRAAREHLLATVARAEEYYYSRRPEGGWKKPRNRKRTFFCTDANGVDHYLTQEQPHADEAAEEALKFLARFDPELAPKVSVTDIEKLLPIWIDRQRNAGRAGKEKLLDEELCALARKVGCPAASAEAMRRQRLKWEKTWPFMRIPEEWRTEGDVIH